MEFSIYTFREKMSGLRNIFLDLDICPDFHGNLDFWTFWTWTSTSPTPICFRDLLGTTHNG